MRTPRAPIKPHSPLWGEAQKEKKKKRKSGGMDIDNEEKKALKRYKKDQAKAEVVEGGVSNTGRGRSVGKSRRMAA